MEIEKYVISYHHFLQQINRLFGSHKSHHQKTRPVLIYAHENIYLSYINFISFYIYLIGFIIK